MGLDEWGEGAVMDAGLLVDAFCLFWGFFFWFFGGGRGGDGGMVGCVFRWVLLGLGDLGRRYGYLSFLFFSLFFLYGL